MNSLANSQVLERAAKGATVLLAASAADEQRVTSVGLAMDEGAVTESRYG